MTKITFSPSLPRLSSFLSLLSALNKIPVKMSIPQLVILSVISHLNDSLSLSNLSGVNKLTYIYGYTHSFAQTANHITKLLQLNFIERKQVNSKIIYHITISGKLYLTDIEALAKKH